MGGVKERRGGVVKDMGRGFGEVYCPLNHPSLHPAPWTHCGRKNGKIENPIFH